MNIHISLTTSTIKAEAFRKFGIELSATSRRTYSRVRNHSGNWVDLPLVCKVTKTDNVASNAYRYIYTSMTNCKNTITCLTWLHLLILALNYLKSLLNTANALHLHCFLGNYSLDNQRKVCFLRLKVGKQFVLPSYSRPPYPHYYYVVFPVDLQARNIVIHTDILTVIVTHLK